MQSYVQGQAFRKNNSTSAFYMRVEGACTVYKNFIVENGYTCVISSLGDGSCSDAGNNTYCIYDGGNCLAGGSIFAGNSNGQISCSDENGDEF